MNKLTFVSTSVGGSTYLQRMIKALGGHNSLYVMIAKGPFQKEVAARARKDRRLLHTLTHRANDIAIFEEK